MDFPKNSAVDLRQTLVAIAQVRPNPRNARTHSKKQICQIAASVTSFGFTSPILIDEDGVLLAGHGRLEAAKLIGAKEIPTIIVTGLSAGKKRALALADNRIAQNAGWDREKLALELESLPEVLALDHIDLTITGFETAEIDALHVDLEEDNISSEDDVESFPKGPAITQLGDLWLLNKHRLLCGDLRSPTTLATLMGADNANMAFLDPPYNVSVRSVVGRGRIKHEEFAMASGEMSAESFAKFLKETLSQAVAVSADGAVHFVCMDWRHMEELTRAGKEAYGSMLNLIVWVKTNAGQGSFYRSQHELIGVFRVGNSPHINNVELGRYGRSRSNVWRYAGVNTFAPDRLTELQAHPTVKPFHLIADAIKDCTRREHIVLDTFCGYGSSIIAAERTGRRARGIEINPRFVDLSVRRWQALTGRDAVHAESGQTFDEIAERPVAGR